jgi:quinol monooxygenase YgiN
MPENVNVFFVHVHVKPDFIQAFREATLANARESVKEPGVVRFDVLTDNDEPTHFVLIEAFRDNGAAMHRETPHYLRWRDAVASMMAEPRTSRKYSTLFWT